MEAERITIVIPTLNEASTLAAAIDRAKKGRNIEIIVADGGSSDNTLGIAESRGVKVVVAPGGRAKQENAAAAAAMGEILLFLHADTHLPNGFDGHIRRVLAEPRTAGGAFLLSIDATNLSLRVIERAANLRSKLLQMPYGDQALFMRTSLFRAMGGFPDMPIMEDFVFVRRLRKRGAVVIAPVPITTSARRWLALGVWRTTIINQAVILAYYIGAPLDTVARWYRAARSPLR
ncbi:MAG: glycosyltransferase [Candidatus Abyssobacteria bacterium SURF_5]|uniref:Glycosyltransferase n=1 Tax=Abyssobacteria bacterium (strain SURF_5) TaxID=2093360 RepID=A0A3A4NND5_ABYX5|nr:MAG: glycosyltransferase [Candidatus Abyssubacteria bacterium SURF_5]